MFTKLVDKFIAFSSTMQAVRNAMVTWNQTRNVEKTRRAIVRA